MSRSDPDHAPVQQQQAINPPFFGDEQAQRDHAEAPVKNVYLEEVMQAQGRVERELRPVQKKFKAAPLARQAADEDTGIHHAAPGTAPQAERAVDYRITGWGPFQTVVVPPNVYVVHTRRGRTKPVNIGMGISFGYNPWKDSFLVIPAAMQTILIQARCICSDRQGILVQAYVQWIIDDIEIAYRKLDFSDSEDPMRIVNVQLREQAEAAIKDKVSTMGIDEVLSDKQPIIDELTHRLREVAEGSREGDGGLGLKIVTVQIKEAVVSSARLWENLQRPFRVDREKVARLAELESARVIQSTELANRKESETAHLEVESELARIRAEKEASRFDREQAESARRLAVEQANEVRAIEERARTERVRREKDLEMKVHELELALRRFEHEVAEIRGGIEVDQAVAEKRLFDLGADLDRKKREHAGRVERDRLDLELLETRRRIENEVTPGRVQEQLIGLLPQIAERLPSPAELRSVNISSDGPDGGLGSLAGLVAALKALLERAAPSNAECGMRNAE